MGIKFANNASALLSANLTNSATAVTLDDVSEFPSVNASVDYAFLTLANSAATKIEIIKVTSINAGTKVLTIVRAQDNTTAQAFSTGDICELRLTAAAIEAKLNEASDHDGVPMAIALG